MFFVSHNILCLITYMWLVFVLSGVKAKVGTSPFLKCPTQFPLILWHPYARHFYFCVTTEKEQQKWHAVLQDCVRHSNDGESGTSHLDTCNMMPDAFGVRSFFLQFWRFEAQFHGHMSMWSRGSHWSLDFFGCHSQPCMTVWVWTTCECINSLFGRTHCALTNVWKRPPIMLQGISSDKFGPESSVCGCLQLYMI